MLEIGQFAVEMALGGPRRNTRSSILVPALRAWKAAQNAAFHIPTATTAAGSRLTKCKNPAKIDSYYRFSRRTVFTLKGLVTYYVLFFIQSQTRRVCDWMKKST